ncbi:hypothetical protein GCM10023162_29660 [Klenkia terrae]
MPPLPSIADRPVAELGGPGSVLSRQRADHVELDRLLHELSGTTGAEQRRVLRRIDRLVFSHAFAEETVLWPVLRRVLPDGEDLTTQVEREHQEVNDLVSSLEEMSDDDPARAALLDRLTTVLREDVRDEEDELFPRLRERLDDAALRRLGLAWAVVSPSTSRDPASSVVRRHRRTEQLARISGPTLPAGRWVASTRCTPSERPRCAMATNPGTKPGSSSPRVANSSTTITSRGASTCGPSSARSRASSAASSRSRRVSSAPRERSARAVDAPSRSVSTPTVCGRSVASANAAPPL